MIAGDEATVNTGNDPFRVRIVSPRVALKLRGRTRVEMAVTSPRASSSTSSSCSSTRRAWPRSSVRRTCRSSTSPIRERIAYFRAVASLKDVPEQPPVEDVVMINTPQFMEEVNVHLVELPTTVLRDGHPITDLPRTRSRSSTKASR